MYRIFFYLIPYRLLTIKGVDHILEYFYSRGSCVHVRGGKQFDTLLNVEIDYSILIDSRDEA